MVDRIRKLCFDNKTSIKALEKELGFGNGTIRRWNTNAPSVERIVMVADRFNVPVAYLTGDVSDPTDRSLTHWAEIMYKKDAPTQTDGRENITFDDFTYAMQNETKDLTDMDKQLLLSMAKQLNDARKQRNGEHK